MGTLHDNNMYQIVNGVKSENVFGDDINQMTIWPKEGMVFKINADTLHISSLKHIETTNERSLWYTGAVRDHRLKGSDVKKEGYS